MGLGRRAPGRRAPHREIKGEAIMSPRRWLFPIAAGVFLGWSVPGSGQVPVGAFDVDIGGGALLHENASGIQPASPLLALQGRYFLTENVAFGFALDYARTQTDDDIFPLVQFRFPTADSTLLVALVQPLAIFHYQLIGSAGTRLSDRLYSSVLAGVGAYTLYTDPQQNAASTRSTDFAFSFGATLKFALGESTGIELVVRDVVYTGFDRDELSLTPDRTCRVRDERRFSGNVCPNERFPFLDPRFSDPNWSPPKSTVHNFAVSAAFTFVPGL